MGSDNLFLISDIEGFSPQIGRLVSMMNYTRHTTLNSVEGLTIRQLDYLYEPNSNSIGALLFHIAAVEFAYRIWTFEERALNNEEKQFWGPGMELGNLGRERIKENDLGYYLDLLHRERSKTLKCLESKDDLWLEIERPFNDKPSNNYFRWFHVFEDELNHRGQIRIIVKKLRNIEVSQ